MSIYESIKDFFKPKMEEKIEEKIFDVSNVLPQVVDGRLSYIQLDNLNKAYSTNYIIHKCINILAFNLSRVPIRIHRNGEPLPPDFIFPNGFDISQPHPRLSLSRLLYECAVYFWYKGEFMSKIDEEVPFSLEIIDPGLMRINTTEGNVVTSWRYTNSITIPNDQLIYARMMNPDNTSGLTINDTNRKVSLVQVVQKELLNYASGREFNTQFFSNYTQLGLTLKDIEGQTTREDRQSIVNEIDNKLSRGKAWKTKCLPQGLDIADTKNLSMREMEFSQTFKDIRDIILGTFGIPRSVFGITNETGLSQGTVDVEKRLMWTDTIQPIAYMVQEAFNQSLKTYYPGYKFIFDYANIDALQVNLTAKADLAKSYQSLGYTINEVNEKLDLGLPEITELVGDMRFVPQALIPVDELMMEPEAPTPKEKPKAKSIENKISSSTYKRKYDRAKRIIEREFTSKLGGYFSSQLGKVLSIVKANTKSDVNEVMLLTDLFELLDNEKDVLKAVTLPMYEKGSLSASKLSLDAIKADTAPKVAGQIVENLASKIGGINNHTYSLLRKQIKESINAGETINDMSKRIQKVYKFSKSRSRTIARTESGQVMQATSYEEYDKGGVKKLQWVGGTRTSHAAQDGQIVNMGSTFMNGQTYACDGTMGAGENINCRCTNAPII